jgi:hypothetical protein
MSIASNQRQTIEGPNVLYIANNQGQTIDSARIHLLSVTVSQKPSSDDHVTVAVQAM